MKERGLDPMAFARRRLDAMDFEREQVKQALSDAINRRVVWTDEPFQQINALLNAAKRANADYLWCRTRNGITLTSVEAEAATVVDGACNSHNYYAISANEYSDFGDGEAAWKMIVDHIYDFTQQDDQSGLWTIQINWRERVCRLWYTANVRRSKAA